MALALNQSIEFPRRYNAFSMMCISDPDFTSVETVFTLSDISDPTLVECCIFSGISKVSLVSRNKHRIVVASRYRAFQTFLSILCRVFSGKRNEASPDISEGEKIWREGSSSEVVPERRIRWSTISHCIGPWTRPVDRLDMTTGPLHRIETVPVNHYNG